MYAQHSAVLNLTLQTLAEKITLLKESPNASKCDVGKLDNLSAPYLKSAR